MTRLASAFAKGRPALVCSITAGDGDVASNLDAPADVSKAKA
jgi:tryptophan synthase alpha chain